jgi:hypothetical protein
MWAALATGRPVPPARPARAGLRYHWLGGDLRRAARERRGGLIGDVGQSIRWGLPAVHPIWSAGDPLPALVCGATFARGRARRLFQTAEAPAQQSAEPRVEPPPEPPVAAPEPAGVA